MKINIEKSTYWFLITALCNFIYAPIVHFFLKNPNLGERFKGINATFYVSYIYVAIGIIWLAFGGLYLIADYSQSLKFTRKSKQLHFFLTLGLVLGLMLVPLLDTFQIATHGGINFISDLFTLLLPPIILLAFFVGIVLFVIDLIRALVKMIITK